jgi:hypothetical protein
MKLRKKQREYLLQLIAEGLQIGEINERATQFRPRFKVTPQQVDYYRQSRGIVLEDIQETGESNALKTGLALRDERVKALKLLADAMLSELTREADKRLWTENSKTVAEERYDFVEFNKAEVDALRGVLDDIAKEVGERRPDTQINNTFNFNMDEWKKARQDRLKEIASLETD